MQTRLHYGLFIYLKCSRDAAQSCVQSFRRRVVSSADRLTSESQTEEFKCLRCRPACVASGTLLIYALSERECQTVCGWSRHETLAALPPTA